MSDSESMLKIMDDGTVEGRTAAMFEDYQGEPGNAGETVFTEAEMISMISGAAAENIDVHIHALGERAIHETLNAIEATREAPEDIEEDDEDFPCTDRLQSKADRTELLTTA